MQRYSIASYSFHRMWENGTLDVFAYIEACRYRYQLSTADIWNGFLHATEYDVEFIKKVRRALDEREMTLENLCCDWCHPWDEDKDKLAQQHAYAEKILIAAEILGAKTIRMDLGVRPREITEEQLDYVSGKFREYAKRGQQAGFKIGPENHWGASRRKCVQKAVRAAVNEPNFGQLLHLGNWDLDEGETLEGNDNEMAPFAIHSHVTLPVMAEAEKRIGAFLDAGYKGTLGIESGDGHEYEFEHAAYVLATTRRAVAIWERGKK